jgi:hypothetical protein
LLFLTEILLLTLSVLLVELVLQLVEDIQKYLFGDWCKISPPSEKTISKTTPTISQDLVTKT